MAKLIASYRFSATGYDAPNTRLIDESGLGNHLPLLAGSPDFTGSYSGKTCFKMHGTAYFGGASLLHPECWTAISVLHPKVLAGESLNYIWATGRDYAMTDHGHQTPLGLYEGDVTFVSPTTSQFIAHRARITDTGGVTGCDVGGSVTTTTGFVSDAWNVVTDVWNGESSQIKKRFGTAAWATSAITQHYQVGMQEEWRLGYRPSGLTVAANHLGCLRIEIYSGDYATEDPTGYAARVAALVANPDL